MERVLLEVRVATRTDPIDLELPAELPARELGLHIGRALQIDHDELGQPLRYLIRVLPLDRPLGSRETLAAAGAWDGHTLQLEPVVAAWLEGASGACYPLLAQEITLGRIERTPAEPEDQQIPLGAEPGSESVSRRHLRLFFLRSQWQAVHLSQTNPTWINGHPLQLEVRQGLRDGDRLRLGALELTFHVGLPPDEKLLAAQAPLPPGTP